MTPEVTEWLALLRAHEGGVTKLNGNYLNHGRPVAGYLADAFGELIRAELLALARPDRSERSRCASPTPGRSATPS